MTLSIIPHINALDAAGKKLYATDAASISDHSWMNHGY